VKSHSQMKDFYKSSLRARVTSWWRCARRDAPAPRTLRRGTPPLGGGGCTTGTTTAASQSPVGVSSLSYSNTPTQAITTTSNQVQFQE
jgi:hypothetical protein